MDPEEVMAARWVKVDELDFFSKSNKMNNKQIDHIKEIWRTVNDNCFESQGIRES